MIRQRAIAGGATTIPGRPGARVRRTAIVRVSEISLNLVIVVSIVSLIVIPILFIILSAFLRDPFDVFSGFTLDTMISAYTSPRIHRSLYQTIAMSLAVGVIATAIGGLLAWVVARFKLRFTGLIEMLIVAPLFMSPLIGVVVWVSLGSPASGILNELLRNWGAPEWLRVNIMSIGGIAFVKVVHYVPYGFLFLTSTLRNTDANLEEASYVAGGNVLRTAFFVVIPLLRSSILSSILFISILATGEFAISAILGVRTDFVPLSVHVYQAVYGFPQDFGRATAIGTMLMAVSVLAFYFYRRTMRDSQRFVTVTGKGFGIRQLEFGVWKYPVLITLGLYIFVTVILPYAALFFVILAKFRIGSMADTVFTFDTLYDVFTTPTLKLAFVNTMILSLTVPVICVAFALVLVYANDRLKLRGSEVATYLASLPIAISGIVFATGIFIVNIRSPLYATLWLIALGLVGSYLTHAIRIVSNGMTQIDRSLEEAAQINGASRNAILTTIMAPLLRPSVYSAVILIFVFSTREINTTIMLYTPDSIMLPVLAWNYATDGYMASAAVVGAIQTVMMIAVIVFARLFWGVDSTKNSL